MPINGESVGAMLDEIAESIDVRDSAPADLRSGRRHHWGWWGASAAAVLILAVASTSILIDRQEETPTASDQGDGIPATKTVERNGVAIVVPSDWDVVRSKACESVTSSAPTVVILDGDVEKCLGYRAAIATRIYLVSMDAPPYGEAWATISEPSKENSLVHLVVGGSMVGTSSASIGAVSVPSRNVAIIVGAGPEGGAEAAAVLKDVRVQS